MKVYSLCADPENYEWLYVEDEMQKDAVLDMFEGAPIGPAWPRIEAQLMREARKPLGDFANIFSGALAMSPRARKVLEGAFSPHGEFLPLVPLDPEIQGWVVFNVTTVLDALDRDSSVAAMFPGSDRAMDISRFAFIPKRVTADVFKIPELSTMVFVSERGAATVRSSQLKGYELEELWDSTTGPVGRKGLQSLLSKPATMAWVHRELTKAERREVDDFVTAAARRLKLSREADPTSTQQAILHDLERLRARRLGQAKAQAAALELGALWGETLCADLGWSWCFATPASGQGRFGVLSPEREYIVFPLHSMLAWITEADAEATSLLLFNMIREGSLPPSEPGSFLVLG